MNAHGPVTAWFLSMRLPAATREFRRSPQIKKRLRTIPLRTRLRVITEDIYYAEEIGIISNREVGVLLRMLTLYVRHECTLAAK